jgi:hypothetical protein
MKCVPEELRRRGNAGGRESIWSFTAQKYDNMIPYHATPEH